MLFLHHSNKLQTLLDILLQLMPVSKTGRAQTNVLQAEQILVQNPGMKRWLQQRISQSTGIAANIEFPLPSRFIWDIFLCYFDDVDSLSAYDAEILRWRLMTLLEQHADDRHLSILYSYLKQDETGMARFQLAAKLAALFDQYLVYRPQMIKGWEQNNGAHSPTEVWQAYLWRLLREQNAEPHRAELILRLIERLTSTHSEQDTLPERVFVFAISALSPLYMNVLGALGQLIDVHIFNLNPCQHYWGDIQSKKEQIKQGETPYTDNELLASLGKQGREYIDLFYDSPFDYIDNHQFMTLNPDTLLNRVKLDVLQLGQQASQFNVKDDQTIRIVSCYSELRELQVLQDSLLDMLVSDESLQAHEIVVMCPDINTLAPYIEAVFGQQAGHKKIPFSISDHNVLSSTPLLQAILDWIKLPTSRFSVNEVLGWLELSALQRAYALDETKLESIRFWIRSNHIHWGLDEVHKQKLGLDGSKLNTWRHGVSRLLTAYTMNDDIDLFGGQVASDCRMDNEEYRTLGQLQKLLDDLAGWSERLSYPARLHSWQTTINSMIDNLLVLDDEEEWLIKPLRDEIANWQNQATQADFNEDVDVTLIHQLLLNALSQGTTDHHYLTGGINFCNLIPMRTLPFRVVCLIGMGDEYFPRNEIPLHLDLLASHPQKGDRSRREDDRYMFLQSLLSAQDSFYVSYVGQDKKDDSSIEPSVVVTELIDHVEQSTGYRLPVIKTSLQAFSNKNFERGSYDELWQVPSNLTELQPFIQDIEQQPEKESILQLDELIAFYNNPARYFMQRRLNMSLYEYEKTIDDNETFALQPLQRYQLNKHLLDDLFDDREIIKEKYVNSGELSAFNSGLLQFEDQHRQVDDMARQISDHAEFCGRKYFDITIKLQGVELTGRVESYAETGFLQYSQSKLKGKLVFSLWIQHCFLCAGEQIGFSEFFYNDNNKNNKLSGFKLLSQCQAKQILTSLYDGFITGRQRALPFYIDTAFEYENLKYKKDEQAALQRIQTLWKGDDYNPFYEVEDIYLQTSLKNSHYSAENFPEEFFDLSTLYMQPLLDNLKDKA